MQINYTSNTLIQLNPSLVSPLSKPSQSPPQKQSKHCHTFPADSPEHQLLHLVVFLISEDFQLLVELLDERLTVLQVAGKLSLTPDCLTALHSRHVLENRGRDNQEYSLPQVR